MQKYHTNYRQVISFKDIYDNKVTVPLTQVRRIGVNTDGEYLVWIDSYAFEFHKPMLGAVVVSKETYSALVNYFYRVLAC